MLKIGNLRLRSPFILAPMSGITDFPFRMLNRRFGCELSFIEMINCRSISSNSKKTRQMLATGEKDNPLGIQLLGCEPKYILKALEVLRNYRFDLLDFNAACPAKKVIHRGEGASLMKEPRKLQSLLQLLGRHSPWPATVKIRAGWDSFSQNALEVSKLAQDSGISAIFIHGRTKEQGYSGAVDYQIIRKVKKALSIPVIASGDIFSPELIKRMFDETGVDAVALARGALGNPWLFEQAEGLVSGLTIEPPDKNEIIKTMIDHLDASITFYGERIGVIKFRKFFAWYTKGFRKVRPLREKCSLARTRKQMSEIFESLKYA